MELQQLACLLGKCYIMHSCSHKVFLLERLWNKKKLNLNRKDLKRNNHCVFIMVSFSYDHIFFFFLLFLYRFMKSKKPAVLIPFLPLSFVVGYQADYVYGGKVSRIRG